MPTVLEGLWEEIVAQGDALKGKRVRVEVLESIVGIAKGGSPDLSVRHKV